MALTIPVNTVLVMTIDEYIEHIKMRVDLRDIDSVAASAPMLAALANDRDFVVRHLNEQVKTEFAASPLASAQSIFLGQGEHFYVRANFWPSSADVTSGRVCSDQFSYDIAHDHNFNFLTVGYRGPGYITEIYEYDYDKVAGYIGERVDISFLERTHFGSGQVMLYRAGKDIHVQYPPEELSVTLNLMVNPSEIRYHDQYSFDLNKKTIIAYPGELDGSRRTGIIEMAGVAGDGNTRQLLEDLALSHPCRRTRLQAFMSLVKLAPEESERIWRRACDDRELLVSMAGAEQLKALER